MNNHAGKSHAHTFPSATAPRRLPAQEFRMRELRSTQEYLVDPAGEAAEKKRVSVTAEDSWARCKIAMKPTTFGAKQAYAPDAFKRKTTACTRHVAQDSPPSFPLPFSGDKSLERKAQQYMLSGLEGDKLRERIQHKLSIVEANFKAYQEARTSPPTVYIPSSMSMQDSVQDEGLHFQIDTPQRRGSRHTDLVRASLLKLDSDNHLLSSDGLHFTFPDFDVDNNLNASPSRLHLRPTWHKTTLASSPLFGCENSDDAELDALDDLERRLLSVSCTRVSNIPGPKMSNEPQQDAEPKLAKNDAPCIKCASSPRGLACVQWIRAGREPENIQHCVHARLCASADAVGMGHSVTVSASVEMNDGKWCLQIWRGPETLASMTVSSLRVATPRARVIELAPKSSQKVHSPVCYLVFEDETSEFQLLRRICTAV